MLQSIRKGRSLRRAGCHQEEATVPWARKKITTRVRRARALRPMILHRPVIGSAGGTLTSVFIRAREWRSVCQRGPRPAASLLKGGRSLPALRSAARRCPRCDHEISKAKKALEQSTHACSVCGESVESSEDGEARKAELQQRAAASATAVKSARDALREEEDELKALGAKAEDLHAQVATHTQALSSAVQRQDAAMAVAVLEGRLEEALSLPATEIQDRSSDLKVLSTLVSETETRVKSLRDGLLEDVSKRLIEYAKDFGLQNLSAATLKGNASLSLIKGGTPTSYSKVTDGEKLRLKVATVLAMIEVAETRGVGRHPGLLMIDSPGAQEVAPEDVDHLVSGLQSIASKLPYLQVFVAGISSPAITSHVPKDRRKEAFGEQFLW